MESHLDGFRPVESLGNAARQVNALIRDVEELTNALKHVDIPEIARVKAKVRMAATAARSALADGAAQVRTRARQVTETTDTFVHENPWRVVGIAALIGLAVGIFAGRRRSS